MNKKIYLFANWKMYLDNQESLALAQALKSEAVAPHLQVAVFPNPLAFSAVAWALNGSSIAVGAQNTYWIERGGYTGEVSAAMYKSAGARFALAGHSERRHVFHESNREVRQKLEAILATGLTPVICVGETLKEKEAGHTNEVLEIQLRSALAGLIWPSATELIIAYEPVWAISHGIAPDAAGLPCDAARAEKMHKTIFDFVGGLLPGKPPVVLFGGSVRPGTIHAYLLQEHIQGVLVGAASTSLDSWRAIAAATS